MSLTKQVVAYFFSITLEHTFLVPYTPTLYDGPIFSIIPLKYGNIYLSISLSTGSVSTAKYIIAPAPIPFFLAARTAFFASFFPLSLVK